MELKVRIIVAPVNQICEMSPFGLRRKSSAILMYEGLARNGSWILLNYRFAALAAGEHITTALRTS